MIRGKIPMLAGMAISLAAGWAGFPRAIYRRVPQPVEFSHRVHAEKAGQSCEDCHAFREDGTFAGMPSLDKCASCHAAAMGTTAAEKRFIDEYVTPQREPHWLSRSEQPENVWFPHSIHVKRGGMKCETCHGNQAALDAPQTVEYDRISGYPRAGARHGLQEHGLQENGLPEPLAMDDCVSCHRKTGRELSCLDCHK